MKSQSSNYLYKIIPEPIWSYRTRQSNKSQVISITHGYFKDTFFHSTIFEWNKLNPKIEISDSIGIFKKSILTFMRVVANSIFNFRNPKSLKLLSRLHLDLSHFGDHKFKHSFQDSLNPFNICRIGKIETCCYYLLHWSNYSTERLDLLNSIKDIDSFFLQKTPRNYHNSNFTFWR